MKNTSLTVFIIFFGISFSVFSQPPIIFYEQGMNSTSPGITSQVFTDLGGPVFAADDFVVPVGEQWDIDRIESLGSKNSNPLSDVQLIIWSHDPVSSLPNTEIYDVVITPTSGPNDPNIILDIDPNNPLVLSEGTYWITIAPILAFSGNAGRWYWTRFGSPVVGEEFQIIDPNDVFGAGYTNWIRGSIFNANLVNLSFRLGSCNGGCTLSVKDQTQINEIKIFPNPAEDIIFINNLNEIDLSSIKIYDSIGRLIKSIDILNFESQIKIDDLVPGFYIISLTSKDNRKFSKRFFKK
ncbi:T9SS type A sorting domain-containing protein [Kordia sp.]|uniref:T9SS type A sorting domain-containing protein n=1 Tax=Kordia sp. TaxID=1965332 RepID=UPI0025BA4D5A|nr:T9SS type A sorting domain-containing protein [Kordia sp.]MCH2193127.1 T9SS type A sorting domain-containing protein [Kordia sp.]